MTVPGVPSIDPCPDSSFTHRPACGIKPVVGVNRALRAGRGDTAIGRRGIERPPTTAARGAHTRRVPSITTTAPTTSDALNISDRPWLSARTSITTKAPIPQRVHLNGRATVERLRPCQTNIRSVRWGPAVAGCGQRKRGSASRASGSGPFDPHFTGRKHRRPLPRWFWSDSGSDP